MSIASKVWSEKFRPKKLEDCFLPTTTKSVLQSYVDAGEIPSLFFSGPSGIGKTTAAIALINEVGGEYIKINGSLNGNIDTLRTEIYQFASTVSMTGGRKYIILDEADGLTAATQASLRGFIDDYSDNASFILTANFRNKIIEPIISRLTEVSFLFPKDEVGSLAKSIFNFLIERLDEEEVKYDIKAVQRFLIERLKSSTDIRKIITDAQKIATTKVFNADSLLNSDDSKLDEAIEAIKNRDFDAIRTWVGENSDIDADRIFRYLYEKLDTLTISREQRAIILITIADRQYKNAFVADKEINLSATMAEIAVAL